MHEFLCITTGENLLNSFSSVAVVYRLYFLKLAFIEGRLKMREWTTWHHSIQNTSGGTK